MRTVQEILEDLDREMPRASLDRRSIEVLRELLGLPEGFSYAAAEKRVRLLRTRAGELRVDE